jgi:hypothetical protein
MEEVYWGGLRIKLGHGNVSDIEVKDWETWARGNSLKKVIPNVGTGGVTCVEPDAKVAAGAYHLEWGYQTDVIAVHDVVAPLVCEVRGGKDLGRNAEECGKTQPKTAIGRVKLARRGGQICETAARRWEIEVTHSDEPRGKWVLGRAGR